MPSDLFATGAHADFMFEVEPDDDVFDTVRRAVVRRLRENHADVFGGGVREHVRVDVVDIDPATWHVEGRLNGGRDVSFAVEVRADTEATDAVTSHLRDTVMSRFGPHVDEQAVAFEKVDLRPAAWFVTAKVPPYR